MAAKIVFVYNLAGYDVYIGRGRCPRTGKMGGLIGDGPGKYGNRWSHKTDTIAEFRTNTVEEAIEACRQYVLARPWLIEQIKHELKDKTLGCWCKTVKHPNAPCHGDFLMEIANA